METYKQFINKSILKPDKEKLQSYIDIILSIYKQIINNEIELFKNEDSVCDYINDILSHNQQTKDLELATDYINLTDVTYKDLLFLRSEYDPNDDLIYLQVSKGFHKIFSKSYKNIKEFEKLIFTNIEHELVHKLQYTRATQNKTDRFNVSYKGGYLDRPDEIMAFAKNVSSELEDIFKNNKQIIDVLKNPKKYIKQFPKHSYFKEYYETFGSDSKVYQRLIKYTLQYLED